MYIHIFFITSNPFSINSYKINYKKIACLIPFFFFIFKSHQESLCPKKKKFVRLFSQIALRRTTYLPTHTFWEFDVFLSYLAQTLLKGKLI